MPGFLYFLPGISRMAPLPAPAEIAARGLSYAFEGRPHGRGCNGPGGVEGYILGCRRRFADAGDVYFEATQIWQPHPSGKYLVGYWPNQLPGPAELTREKQLEGYLVELADERRWQVPQARSVHDNSQPNKFGYQWSCELPQRAGINEHGQWVEQGPLPRYQALWQLVCGWNDYRRGDPDDPDRPSLADHWDLYQTRYEAAVQILAANYVVGPVECTLLGNLNKELAAQILDLAIDEPELNRILGKFLAAVREAQPTAAAAGSSSTPGPLVETIPTPLPSQT